MKTCASDGYVEVDEGGEVYCESPYLTAYYYSGVLDVEEGRVRVRVDAGPNLRTAVEDVFEAPSTIVLTPVVLAGPSRLAIRCEEGPCRLWYRIVVVDILQAAMIASILAGATTP